MRSHSLALGLAAALLLLQDRASAQWVDTGSVLQTDDRVLIGPGPPQALLSIAADASTQTAAVVSTMGPYGLSASIHAENGIALTGVSWVGGPGWGTGVYAGSSQDEGFGLYARATGSGVNYGVHSETTSENGYSGFFKGGKFCVEGDFVGINRTQPINASEALGITGEPGGWIGSYMDGVAGGRPYYGYAMDGTSKAYHYYDPGSASWRLYVNGGIRMSVGGSQGRVGIGTFAPAHKLHVNGSAGKPGGGSWSTASDVRLKKDIEPIEDALERLLSLRGVTFEYLDPDSIHELHGRRTGVIAQEVEAAFPDWVDEGDDGFKRVTFRGFEGVVVEAMRELRTENEQLRAEIAEIRAMLAERE